MQHKIKSISYDHRVTVFWALIVAMIVSTALYVYAVSATTRNVAQRQELEREIASLASRQAALEFTYIGERNKISMEVAHEYGFQEVSSPLYVSRNLDTSLTLAAPANR